MRKIKFRAWDAHENKLKKVANYELSDYLEYQDGIELMQFADLYDKNGEEVYEGDILKVYELSNTNEKEYTSPVEYFESCFFVTEPNEAEVPLYVFHNLERTYPLFEIEVIGNIYENSND